MVGLRHGEFEWQARCVVVLGGMENALPNGRKAGGRS